MSMVRPSSIRGAPAVQTQGHEADEDVSPPSTLHGGELSGAVSKGLLLLETMIEAAEPLPLSALVDRVGLPKTTTHRLLGILSKRGWVRSTERGYGLGHVLLRAATVAEDAFDIRRDAHSYLSELRDTLGETVHLAILDQEYRTVYLDKLAPKFQAVGLMQSRVGWTVPAYCTAVGKAMLACLSDEERDHFYKTVRMTPFTSRTIVCREALESELLRVQALGYAICDEEHEEGVSCVAAVIQGRSGTPLGAISLSGPTARMSSHLTQGSASIRKVRDAARRISLVASQGSPASREGEQEQDAVLSTEGDLAAR